MKMNEGIDDRLCPENLMAEYRVSGNALEMDFTVLDKPANRMAESYWMSFVPEGITSISAEKMGSMVDVREVVEGGNARMMGIDRYVELYTTNGVFRVYSPDVPLVFVGALTDLSYKSVPDVTEGIHFNIFNNLWGVNYSMWWSGSQRFRFIVEKL